MADAIALRHGRRRSLAAIMVVGERLRPAVLAEQPWRAPSPSALIAKHIAIHASTIRRKRGGPASLGPSHGSKIAQEIRSRTHAWNRVSQ